MTSSLHAIAVREGALLAPIQKREEEASKLKHLFVCPVAEVVPEDGIIKFVTVDTLLQVLQLEPRVCVMFRPDQDQLLTLICQHRELMGLEIQALVGVPGVTYAPWFDTASFGPEKISYAPLISEVTMHVDAQRQAEANRPKTTVEREELRSTRQDGTKRYADISVGSDEDDGALDG